MRLLTVVVLTCGFLAAQPQQSTPAFDVVSIKPHTAPIPRGGGHLSTSGGRMSVEVYSLLGLIMYAYQVKPFEIDDVASLDHTMYDIGANAGGDRIPTTDEFRAMMRSLLAERFHLRVHRETRTIPVYALVADKGAAKLAPSTAGAEPKRTSAIQGRNYQASMTVAGMDDLADYLRSNAGLDRPVVNLTGIEGTFDLQLTYTPETRMAGATAADADTVPIAVALREQLGLRLDRRDAPHSLLIIDHVEKPSDN